jgi:hypothetical protein
VSGVVDFTIYKKQALFNGFFTRLSVSEVVMDWGLPNIASWWGNNTISVYFNNAGTVSALITVTIPDGFYTALDALNAVAVALNANTTISTAGVTFSVTNVGTRVVLAATSNFVVYWAGPNSGVSLARQLFTRQVLYPQYLPNGAVSPSTPVPPATGNLAANITCVSPLILGTNYVDIVSKELTYNQDLKDTTTAEVARDVIYRWYLAWDTIPGNDSLQLSPSGSLQTFPVYQGYRPFVQRRALPYPKQIAWNNTQSVGQVTFQVYDDQGRLIDTDKFALGANFQFQMSMLATEN